MKKLLDGFKSLDAAKKIESALAAILTLAIILGTPAFAWFSSVKKAEVLTKIKEPENLDIRAGNYDEVINFDLRDIDVAEPDYEDTENHTASKYYVFSVSAGDYKIPYIIQVAHTTNIPLEYKLFKADRTDYDETDVEADTVSRYAIYHPIDDVSTKTYYKIKGTNMLKMLNDDDSEYGRKLGQRTGTHYEQTYNIADDTPQIYAIPIYLQTDTITWDENNSEHDYYVLELEWDTNVTDDTGFSKFNAAKNNKETDIIYISAGKVTA